MKIQQQNTVALRALHEGFLHLDISQPFSSNQLFEMTCFFSSSELYTADTNFISG